MQRPKDIQEDVKMSRGANKRYMAGQDANIGGGTGQTQVFLKGMDCCQ